MAKKSHKCQKQERNDKNDKKCQKYDDNNNSVIGSINMNNGENGVNCENNENGENGDSGESVAVVKRDGNNSVEKVYTKSINTNTELTHQNIYTRLRCFEREMVARTSSKVRASREAATMLHSPSVLTETFRVEGVSTDLQHVLMRELEVLNIGAHLSGNLEIKLRDVLTGLQVTAQ